MAEWPYFRYQGYIFYRRISLKTEFLQFLENNIIDVTRSQVRQISEVMLHANLLPLF